MKNLVKHLVHSNMNEILEKSLLNCHIKGLHSIMLLEKPGSTIRMYITDENHQLYEKDALAFHPHHCDLTLHCVCGVFDNVILRPDSDDIGFSLRAFEYKSAILEGNGGFIDCGTAVFRKPIVEKVVAGESIFLGAHEIHNVVVPKYMRSAWFVYEGKEDKHYESYAYSNKALDKPKVMEGLYVKPDQNQILHLLKSVNMY